MNFEQSGPGCFLPFSLSLVEHIARLFLYVIVVVVYVDGVGGGVVWKTVGEAKRVDSIEIPHFNIINFEIALPGENWIGKRGAGARGPPQQAPLDPDRVRALGRAKDQGLAIASDEEGVTPGPCELIQN